MHSIETISISAVDKSGVKKVQCFGLTKKKIRCKNLVNNSFCYHHNNDILKKKTIFTNAVSNTAKEFDQYYTKESSVKLCMSWYCQAVNINKELDLIIEPAAGCGSFYNFIFNLTKNKIFLDLYPKHFDIIQKDFLKFEVSNNSYSNIHVIGNPPFKQITSFVQKASQFGDFIGFILPLSYKKDSKKNQFPLNFHCIFSKEMPRNSFLYEGEIKNIPTVFQI